MSLGNPELRVTGSGTYRIGGEFAAQQQLSLDLRVGEKDLTHFDSGLVPGGAAFPRIDALISISGAVCYNTWIDVHAWPRRRLLR